jgi:hypothetical protein
MGRIDLPDHARCIGGAGPIRAGGAGPLLDGTRECQPGTPLRLVPQGDHDWKWVDEQGHGYLDTAPTLLRTDPAKWWQALVDADPGLYSVLSSSSRAHMLNWHHQHQPERGSVEPYRGELPTCCGQPMQYLPVGWRCRQSGTVFDFQDGA